MKLAAAVLALSLLIPTTVFGQVLEGKIVLPDPYGGAALPQCLAYNSRHHKMYVGGELTGWVSVIDCSTNERIAHIEVGEDVRDICYNPTDDKVYCAAYKGGSVAVVDGAADTLLAVLTGHRPFALCYTSVSDKVYCATEDSVMAIDGRTNERVAALALYNGVEFSYNSVANVVYCVSEAGQSLTAIDCYSDTVVARVSLGGMGYAVCYNPRNDKVYCAVSGGDDAALVFNSALNTLLATIPVTGPGRELCYNAANNKVYCGSDFQPAVTVIDGETDSILAVVGDTNAARSICWNPSSNKVYCDFGRKVLVLDGTSDSVVASIPGGPMLKAIGCSPELNRVYCANYANHTVTVIDGNPDTAMTTLTVGATPRALCANARDNKLYAACQDAGVVYVIDCVTSRQVAAVPVGPGPEGLLWGPGVNKVYCANTSSWSVTVIDGPSNQVLKTVPTGTHPRAMCWNSLANRVYVVNEYAVSVSVIDASRDSVIAHIIVPEPFSLDYSPASNKVYCGSLGDSTPVFVIDGTSNRVIATVNCEHTGSVTRCSPAKNKVYCGSSRICILDERADTILATVGWEGSWTDISIALDGKRVFCSDTYGGRLFVLDGESDTVVAELQLSGWLAEVRLAYDAFNSKVYYASQWPDSTFVIDAHTCSVVAAFQTGPSAAVWNPTAGKVYVADYSGSCVTVIRDSAAPPGLTGAEVGLQPRRMSATVVRQGVPLEAIETGSLMDIAGRRVAVLRAGLNDIRHLAPGVYFVRAAVGGERSAVRKVVVTR